MKKTWILFFIIIMCIVFFILVLNSIKTNKSGISNDIDSCITSSGTVIQEELIDKAEARGFKRGIIQHSLNTKWSEFGDKDYYTYIKTLNSGMKLYRMEVPNMLMEVYVMNDIVAIQSSIFMTNNATDQLFKEMNAWLESCKPKSRKNGMSSVNGEALVTITYLFEGYEATLVKRKQGIQYMLSTSGEIKRTNTSKSVLLDKLYANEFFSLKYPTSWQIVQDGNQVTNSTKVSLQIMEKQKNETDFRPNINIIVSKRKWNEPTSFLAKQSISQNRNIMSDYNLLNQNDDIVLNNSNGTLIDYTFNIQGYRLHGMQYIVKKKDNTTFIITATTDAAKHNSQEEITKAIINSIIIK